MAASHPLGLKCERGAITRDRYTGASPLRALECGTCERRRYARSAGNRDLEHLHDAQ